MIGNEAVARGLYEAGVSVVSSYPGTPSTEITEFVAKYNEVDAEWAANEKVAMEVAIGAAISGARSFCAMKHVGLNVAADPLFTVSYTGVNGGLVIGVADDPGMHSSQNEQDSRNYANAAKVTMLEPADSTECKEYAKLAYEISEQFDTPVLLRLTTRIAHSQSIVEECDRVDVPLKEYQKDVMKYVMMPGMAKKRRLVIEDRKDKLVEYAETSGINRMELNDTKIGIITAGAPYQYAKESFPEASYLKLGMLWPLPTKLIQEFASKVEKLYVLEELDPYIENHIKAMGIEVHGKDTFSMFGEFSNVSVREAISGKKDEATYPDYNPPMRPPVMCPGCPHRGMFYVLSKLKLVVSGDIGCYTLGAAAPLSAMDTTICMGASVSAAHGISKANPELSKKTVAVIGDSTFIHSGMTGLASTAYNKGTSTVIILDNSITGMTGHQQNPTTGKTLKGEPTVAVNLEKFAEAVGYTRIKVVDPFNVEECERVIKEEISVEEPSLIIARRPCVLLKGVKYDFDVNISKDKCKNCKMCMKIGCPAISIVDGKPEINKTLCTNCGLCKNICKFDAITL
ncbi:MAG: indolepyruvate ferredoxin oxidoreductase subunit alpha [Ruminococcaceae bacterium]|nr:indolepyruvate ferredoxin oxidoreductase subunit alpha [Oscillospiraceae bacterium]